MTEKKVASLCIKSRLSVFFVIAALPFVFVAIVLIMLRYMDEEEVAYLDLDAHDKSTDESAAAKSPKLKKEKKKKFQ
jgi:hypothetical protein